MNRTTPERAEPGQEIQLIWNKHFPLFAKASVLAPLKRQTSKNCDHGTKILTFEFEKKIMENLKTNKSLIRQSMFCWPGPATAITHSLTPSFSSWSQVSLMMFEVSKDIKQTRITRRCWVLSGLPKKERVRVRVWNIRIWRARTIQASKRASEQGKWVIKFLLS